MSEVAFTRIESERLRIRRFKDCHLSPFMAPRAADNTPMKPTTAASHQQEVVLPVARGGST